MANVLEVALAYLRAGRLQGAAVLVPSTPRGGAESNVARA